MIWVLLGANATAFGQSSITPISTFVQSVLKVRSGTSATSNPIGFVRSVAAEVNATGSFYIASPEHNRVYRIERSGEISLFAGTTRGFSGDGGRADRAQLSSPTAVAQDGAGNVYIADAGNSRIRKVSGGKIRSLPFEIPSPRALAIDSENNLYISASPGIIRIDADGGFSIVLRNSSSAIPNGLAVDASGDLYIADTLENRVRKLTTSGELATIAGTGTAGSGGDGGPAESAQLNHPQSVAFDRAGNLYIADYFNHIIRKVTPGGTISTVAGTRLGSSLGTGGFDGDGGAAVQAKLKNPISVSVDGGGNLYIADSNNNRIRRVSPEGIIETVAGNGALGGSGDFRPHYVATDPAGNVYLTAESQLHAVHKVGPDGSLSIIAGSGGWGFRGDGGPAIEAQFRSPSGMAWDSQGNLYIADSGNHRVRKVNRSGIVTTVAGNGVQGFSGDGGLATAASLSYPAAVALDSEGNLYISDTHNHRIRKVSGFGVISTFAGNGRDTFEGDGVAVSVALPEPVGLAVDSFGVLISSDHRVRRASWDGRIRTIAGTGEAGFNGDGPATSATLFTPWGLATDAEGNIYIADTNNHRIRKLDPDGGITTIAGTGVAGANGDGGPPTSAEFYGPTGIALDPAGLMYVADGGNGAIRLMVREPVASYSVMNSDTASAQTSGASPTVSTGYGKVVSNASRPTAAGLAIFGVRKQNVLVSEATVPASSPLSRGRIYAEVNGAVNTGLAIVNPNAAVASVNFYFTNADGDFNSGSFSIVPGEHMAAFLNQAPFNGGSFVQGSFTFTASVPVAVTALRGFTNERSEFLITTLPVLNLDAPALIGETQIPHYASGGGWTTQVMLVNREGSTVAGKIHWTGGPGAVEQITDYAIPPRGAHMVRAPIAGDAVTSGVVRIVPVQSDAPRPASSVVFSYKFRGVTVSEAGVAAAPPGKAFRLYVESVGAFHHGQLGSLQTGLAVSNPSSNPVTLNLTIDPPDSLSHSGSLTIPANGRVAFFLHEIPGISSMPAPFQGELRILSDEPVFVIGLRARYNERGDFLITTTAPVNDGLSRTTDPLFFPHFADSGGYTTQFILLSGEAGQPSTGFLRFFSQNGQVLELLR